MGKKNDYDMMIEFITENRSMYYRLAYSYVRNKEDALDIIQDSIYKALSSIKTLERPEVVKTWFYRIIINTSLDFIRKNKHCLYIEDEVLESVAPAMEDQHEDIDLKVAIDKLPVLSKTVILLRFYEGLKIEDIAKIMNENVNTTKTRLYTALKKLKLELEEPLLNGGR